MAGACQVQCSTLSPVSLDDVTPMHTKPEVYTADG